MVCPDCGQHYHNKLAVIQHMLKKHSTPKGEQCPYCDFRYTDLQEHISRRHPDISDAATYNCSHCGKKIKSLKSLKMHLKNLHGPKKRRQQESTELASVGNAAEAVPSLNFKTFMGEESNDGFTSTAQTKAKRKHIPVHLSGICPYCELKFADLLGHIRHNHDKEKDREVNPKAHECQLCQESFKSVRELLTHRQLHPQFAHHVCGKCSSEFETVVELRYGQST